MSRSDNLTGAMLMMASMAAFTFNDTLMKMMAGEVPLYQLLFLRGVLTTAAVSIIVWRMRAWPKSLPGKDWLLIALRTVAEVAAAYFFLTALFNMQLANVTAILQALPLTLTLAAAVFLKEPVGWRRMMAILVGFVGVILIVRPGAESFNLNSLYALAAVACVTLRDLTTRRLSAHTPSMFVTLITSASVMITFGLASLIEPWLAMSADAFILTCGAAFFVIGGYLFSIMVMRVGDVGFTTLFRYTSLIWALPLGWLVFDQWPDAMTFLGVGLVVGSGAFTLLREAKLRAAK